MKAVEFRSWDFLSPWEGAEYARPAGLWIRPAWR